jgi:hypothetical protein
MRGDGALAGLLGSEVAAERCWGRCVEEDSLEGAELVIAFVPCHL